LDSLAVASWQEGKWWGRADAHFKFSAVEKLSKYLLVRKCLSKMQTLGLKKLYFGKFKGKIKMLSTYNLFC